MKVLITGITGFAGSHLTHYLESKNIEIFGIYRGKNNKQNLITIAKRATLIKCDICDKQSLKNIIAEIKPERIFHLAGQASELASRKDPEYTYLTNIFGTTNLLEAVRSARIDPLIHISGSSAEYGLVHKRENPVRENNPFRPTSPYGVSKVAQEMVGFQYFQNYHLRVVCTRTFNHIGPRAREDSASSSFAKQIATIEKGGQKPIIYVGNLNSSRDLTDIRDVVKGYWLALEKGIPGETYNICSGHSYSIRSILEIFLNMTTVNIEVKQDLKRVRPSDSPLQTGDCSKFRAQTGWQPQIDLKKSLEDLLNYWREQV